MGKKLKTLSLSIRNHTNDIGHSIFINNICILDNIGDELDMVTHKSYLILGIISYLINKTLIYSCDSFNLPVVLIPR